VNVIVIVVVPITMYFYLNTFPENNQQIQQEIIIVLYKYISNKK